MRVLTETAQLKEIALSRTNLPKTFRLETSLLKELLIHHADREYNRILVFDDSPNFVINIEGELYLLKRVRKHWKIESVKDLINR